MTNPSLCYATSVLKGHMASRTRLDTKVDPRTHFTGIFRRGRRYYLLACPSGGEYDLP
jgi:hypothetical protein